MERQDKMRDYVKTQSVFKEALPKLKKGREIAFRSEDLGEFVLFYTSEPMVEFRPQKSADVCFNCSTPAIDSILEKDFESVASFGIHVLKLIAKKEIGIQILTGPFKLLTGGYIDIIRLGATKEFWGELKHLGIGGPTDILKLFKSLKK